MSGCSVSWIFMSNGELRIISGKICQRAENQGRSLSHKCLGADLAGCRAGGAAKTSANSSSGQNGDGPTTRANTTHPSIPRSHHISYIMSADVRAWVTDSAICFELYCAEMGYGSVPRLPIYCGCCQTALQHITESLLLFYSSTLLCQLLGIIVDLWENALVSTWAGF